MLKMTYFNPPLTKTTKGQILDPPLRIYMYSIKLCLLKMSPS